MLTGDGEIFLPYFLSFVVFSSEIFLLLYSVEASWVLNNPLKLGSSFPRLLEIILRHLTPKTNQSVKKNPGWWGVGTEIGL